MIRSMLLVVAGLIPSLGLGQGQTDMDPNEAPDGANAGVWHGRQQLQIQGSYPRLRFNEDDRRWDYEALGSDGIWRSDTILPGELLPGGGGIDDWESSSLADLQGLEIAELEARGVAAKEALEQSSSPYGQAYRTFRDTAALEDPGLEQEVDLWRQIDTVPSTINALTQAFGNCRHEVEHVAPGQVQGVASDFRTCERFTSLSTCSRSRTVETSTQTFQTTIERQGMLQPEQITMSMLDQVPEGFSIGDVVVQFSWEGTVSHVDLDSPWLGNGWQGLFDIQLDPEQFQCQGQCSVNDADCECELVGEAQEVIITVDAEIVGVRTDMASEPAGCLDGNDGFCHAQWTCTDSEPRVINGVLIGAHNAGGVGPLYPYHAGHSPPDSEAPFCWAAEAVYDCPYNLGSAGCWETPGQLTVCHENRPEDVIAVPVGGGTASTCPLVDPTNECFVVQEECADGARGHGGFCYVRSVTLRCEEVHSVDRIKTREVFDCGTQGQLRCLGDDCLRADLESRHHTWTDQTYGRAMQKVQQHLHTDYTYIEDSPNAVWTMAGIPVQCRKALGGGLDHCNVVFTGGLQEYLALSDLVAKVDRALADINAGRDGTGGELPGAAERLRDPANHRWAELRRPLVNTEEHVSGGRSAQEIADTARMRIRSSWGDRAANALYGAADAIGYATTLSSLARAREGFVMGLEESVSEDWMGTFDEYQLASARELGACLHVGGSCRRNGDHQLNGCAEYQDTFCCYDSHVARILHEQADAIQGLEWGGGFGTPSEPMCPGFVSLPTGQGWQAIRIEEILGREARADVDWAAERLDAQFNMERTTGSGNLLGPAARTQAGSRAQQRVRGLPTDAIRRAVNAELSAGLEAPVDDPTSPGSIRLSPALVSARVYSDRPSSVRVAALRTGSAGEVSVRLRVHDPQPAWYTFPAFETVLTWNDGESGVKHARVPLPATQGWGGFNDYAVIELSEPTGGATLQDADSKGRIRVVHRSE